MERLTEIRPIAKRLRFRKSSIHRAIKKLVDRTTLHKVIITSSDDAISFKYFS